MQISFLGVFCTSVLMCLLDGEILVTVAVGLFSVGL